MRVKGLNLYILSLYLFLIVFFCLETSCNRKKTIDLRENGAIETVQEVSPSIEDKSETPIEDKKETSIEDKKEDPLETDLDNQNIFTNKKYIKLVSGDYHNCAITEKKHVVCWGSSAYGQSGVEGSKHDSLARLIKIDKSHLLSNVKDIVAGSNHSCALLEDETVKCWGAKGYLGHGETTDQYYAVDVLVDSKTKLHGVKDITSRVDHTCAIYENSRYIKCWGNNERGQLGNNNTNSQLYAVNVVKVENEVESNLEGALKVVSGLRRSCAVMSDKGAKCWGSSNGVTGILGDNTSIGKPYAVDVKVYNNVKLENARDIVHSTDFSCIVLENNEARCWGNTYGVLGNGSIYSSVYGTPVKVDGSNNLEDIKELSLGEVHGCALLNSGGVKCWGFNSHGQVGNGKNNGELYATDVMIDEDNKLEGVKKISSNGLHTCAVLENGELKCWGINLHGQLGNGTTTNSLYATSVKVDGNTNLKNVKDINFVSGKYLGTYSRTCVLLKDGSIKCFGVNSALALGYGNSSYADEGIKVSKLSNKSITKMITIGQSYCIKLLDGEVKCWGKNNYSQLGNGRLDDDLTYILEPDYVYISEDTRLQDVTDIMGEGDRVCVIVGDDKTLKCWGKNVYGKIGNNSNSSTLSYAVNVLQENGTSLSGVNKVLLYSDYSCALLDNEELKCWGRNKEGQLGIGNTTNKPYAMNVEDDEDSLSNVKDLIVPGISSDDHVCAIVEITSNRYLKCWGNNGYGQLGVGDTSVHKLATNVIDEGSNNLVGVSKVVGGSNDGLSTCAIVGANDTLKCWGYNNYGQLGNGDKTQREKATTVKIKNNDETTSDLINVKKVVVGNFSCAIVGENNNLKCWGKNDHGQVGNKSEDAVIKYASDVLNEDGTPLSGVDDFKVYSDTVCAISSGKVKCWGTGGNGVLVQDEDVRYAKDILNKDGTVLSNVKDLSIMGYIGYAILNNDKNNSLIYWGLDGNSAIYPFEPYSSLIGKGRRKVPTAQPVLLKDGLKPIKNVSEIMSNGNTTWIRTSDGNVYLRGQTRYLGNETELFSTLPKTIDTSLVVDDE